MEFVHLFPGLGQCFFAARGNLVDPAATSPRDNGAGLEEACRLQAVEQGIEGSRTDAVTVVRELLHHREAEDRFVRCVEQDVDPDEPGKEFLLFF